MSGLPRSTTRLGAGLDPDDYDTDSYFPEASILALDHPHAGRRARWASSSNSLGNQSLERVGSRLGLSAGTVRNWLTAKGVPTRDARTRALERCLALLLRRHHCRPTASGCTSNPKVLPVSPRAWFRPQIAIVIQMRSSAIAIRSWRARMKRSHASLSPTFSMARW